MLSRLNSLGTHPLHNLIPLLRFHEPIQIPSAAVKVSSVDPSE